MKTVMNVRVPWGGGGTSLTERVLASAERLCFREICADVIPVVIRHMQRLRATPVLKYQ
jgi:hypothetical protein